MRLMNLNWGPIEWWLAAGMLLIIFEIFSPFFGFILVAGATLFGALFAYLGFSITSQLCVFGIATILTITLLRPRIVAKIYSSPGLPNNRAQELIGKQGKVTVAIDPNGEGGRVQIMGLDW